MINTNKQEAVEKFVEREIYACQTMLIEALFKKDIFSYSSIENLYRPFDGELISPNRCYTCNGTFDAIDSETGQCQECFEENQQPQEIYAWWIVSGWLAHKLASYGEPILSNEYGTWWGRGTYGQSIFMDSVIHRIYDDVTSY